MKLKVLHLCLASFYIDNYSYQENMLPKYHKKSGYDVEIIASLFTFDQYGQRKFLDKPTSYTNEYGIQVTRLAYKKTKLSKRLRQYEGTYDAIDKSQPDIIFIHGCQFSDIKYVVNYAKIHPEIQIYVDNHADFSNSARNFMSKNILHKIIWKRCANLIEPFVTKFYGVLPARVDFLKNIYGLPEKKIELLVMGADDEKVKEANDSEMKRNIRRKYGIKKDDFLIMTGGKIDNAKKQTLMLMKAIKNIPDKKVKLIVFGSVIPELQDEINELADGKKIQYIGWVKSDDSYKYFSAADLAVFPGRHSVFWEQVVGQGIPMIVKSWEGTKHVDLGGNVIFLNNDSPDEIKESVYEIYSNPELYSAMLKAAEKGKEVFSYEKIAKRSISH